MTTSPTTTLTTPETPARHEAERAFFADNGFAVSRTVFSPDELVTLRQHFMARRAEGAHPGDWPGYSTEGTDPLRQFPRMINMHDWDDTTRRYMLDARLAERLRVLLGAAPFAIQSMLYFKPPGARGQALHQDNFYLKAQPGTCMAAWIALDDCDEENGCMQIVPQTHELPIVCPVEADESRSFTNVETPLAPTMETQSVLMQAGDVLFFNGSLIHGSFPNTSRDRFRRSLIFHYVEGKAQSVGSGGTYWKMNGEEITLPSSPNGGPCGVWTDLNGVPQLEMTGSLSIPVGEG